MTRNWSNLGLPALLTTTLLATQSAALALDPEKKPTDLKEILRRLENIENGLTEIQKSAASIRVEGLKINVLKGRIDALEAQVGKMQPVLDALRKLMNGKERISAYPPEELDDLKRRLVDVEKKVGSSARIAKAAPEVGRLVLANRYAEEITFVFNNRDTYTVAPGMTRIIEGYPAGVLTYQIQSPSWGPRDRVTSTLPINETVRLTVD